MTWKDESSKTWKARPSGVGTEAYSDEALSIYFCVENLSARFLWSNEVTLRVAHLSLDKGDYHSHRNKESLMEGQRRTDDESVLPTKIRDAGQQV